MLPHPSTNFEILRYFQKEPRFNDLYSRNNRPRIKDGTYVIDLEEHKSTGTQVNGDNIRTLWQIPSWIYSYKN